MLGSDSTLNPVRIKSRMALQPNTLGAGKIIHTRSFRGAGTIFQQLSRKSNVGGE
jgi:hypothetical protein